MAPRLPASFAPELFSPEQLARTMVDDYNNPARQPVCRFDNDLLRSDQCNGQASIPMNRCRVVVGMHQGLDSCKPLVRAEGFPVQYPSKPFMRTQGTPAQYPSKPSVHTQGTPAQYPCKPQVRIEGTPAQYPSKPSVRTQGTPAQYPFKPSVRAEDTPAQYQRNLSMRTQGTPAQYNRTASVSQPPAVTGGKRKLPIDKKMVKTKNDLELFLQTDEGKKWKRDGPIRFDFGYRKNDAIFYASSTDEGMVLTEEVVTHDFTFKLFQWVLDLDGEWDLIPLMGPRKKIKKAPTKAEDAFVDSLLK